MASVSFEYDCSREAGFVTNPNQNQRFGYVTSLGGLGLAVPLARDLIVRVTFNKEAAPRYSGLQFQSGLANVVGVIEKFNWNGGAGDPIVVDFYVSQVNAMWFKARQQTALMDTTIHSFGWWIADYDQEHKQWFEQSYPLTGMITGVIQGRKNLVLNVSLVGVPAVDGIETLVYKISLAVVSAGARAYILQFFSAANRPVTKSWGIMDRTLAAAGLPKV